MESKKVNNSVHVVLCFLVTAISLLTSDVHAGKPFTSSMTPTFDYVMWTSQRTAASLVSDVGVIPRLVICHNGVNKVFCIPPAWSLYRKRPKPHVPWLVSLLSSNWNSSFALAWRAILLHSFFFFFLVEVQIYVNFLPVFLHWIRSFSCFSRSLLEQKKKEIYSWPARYKYILFCI